MLPCDRRYKLTSAKFIGSLRRVRSLQDSEELLKDPSMASVARMLLWASSVPMPVFEADPQLLKAVRRLNMSGHVVIDADERLVAKSSIGERHDCGKVLHAAAYKLTCTAQGHVMLYNFTCACSCLVRQCTWFTFPCLLCTLQQVTCICLGA